MSAFKLLWTGATRECAPVFLAAWICLITSSYCFEKLQIKPTLRPSNEAADGV